VFRAEATLIELAIFQICIIAYLLPILLPRLLEKAYFYPAIEQEYACAVHAPLSKHYLKFL